jgi:hypothetical protein
MDTQGCDLAVFQGTSRILDQVRLRQSEISFRAVYENAPSYMKMTAEYESKGFLVSGIFPISRGADLALIESDLVMVERNGAI